jgi:rhodanese-related sulfurtransferase
MKTTGLIVALLGILFLNACDSTSFRSKKASFSSAEIKTMLNDDILFVDVRNYDEVEELAFDVKNIINIPVDSIENHLHDIPKNKQVILVCRSGRRSESAYTLLKNKGYENIANLEGGIDAWKAEGLPTILPAGEEKKCCSDPTSKDCNPDGTCKESSSTEKLNNSASKEAVVNKSESALPNNASKIIIYAFHGTRQCETCINMKANTKIVLDKYFSDELKSGKISFRIIDVDDSKNEKIAEKFQATGTALFAEKLIDGNDIITDWSDFAFDNANNRDVYMQGLKNKISNLLK